MLSLGRDLLMRHPLQQPLALVLHLLFRHAQKSEDSLAQSETYSREIVMPSPRPIEQREVR